jgi:hypothetical protein
MDDTEIDAHVQRLLQRAAHEEAVAMEQQAENNNNEEEELEMAMVDENLASYVTSCLRRHAKQQIVPSKIRQQLPEYESLIELLCEQCHIENTNKAEELLREIAEIVFGKATVVVSFSGLTLDVADSSNNNNPTNQQSSSSTVEKEATAAAAAEEEDIEIDSAQAPIETATSTTILTTNNALSIALPIDSANTNNNNNNNNSDNYLLPGDLLEEDEAGGVEEDDNDDDDKDEDDIFPPLPMGAKNETHRKLIKHHHHHNNVNSINKGALKTGERTLSSSSAAEEAEQLAAALFRPTRSRQSSIDETCSPNLNAVTANPPTISDPITMGVAEMLLSIYPTDISEDAALTAAAMSGQDIHLAQYILDQAARQTPICRHLLSDGCYRADCQFSHEIDTHTCLFWFKSRCSKGVNCKFLHGLAEKLMEGYDPRVAQRQQQAYAYDLGNRFQPSSTYEQPLLPPQAMPQPYAAYHPHYDTNGNVLSMPPPANSSWIPSPPPSANSFAGVALSGYGSHSFATSSNSGSNNNNHTSTSKSETLWLASIPTTKIPQDLWNPHENRDASAFHIADPMERYFTVTANTSVPRDDVIDLHFQSLKTFGIVLDTILPEKLQKYPEVWIITGTGHHVGSRTHQKGGGALETAVLEYLTDLRYNCFQGRDRVGQGGAILVKR